MWFQGFVSLVLLTIKCDCSTSVYFSMDEYIDYVNGATQLNCTVTGLLSAYTVIFSRKKKPNDTEQILSTLEVGKQPKLNISGMHISIVELSANDSIFILTIDSVSCGDRGTYLCKVGDRQALAGLIIWRKLGIPTFTMSRIIVENRFMPAEYPLICEGEVGEPGGKIFVETYTNGAYTQYQYYEVSRYIKVSEDTCSTYVTLKFALPGSVSLAMNNTAMRCVATNNITHTLNESPPTSESKRLHVVPDNFCNGLSDGNYSHPYECTMFIECSSQYVIVDTCRTRCANVTGIGKISCQNCSSVDCMHQATTSTTVRQMESPSITSTTVRPMESPFQSQATYIVIIGVLGAALIILVVVVIWRKRRLCKRPRPTIPVGDPRYSQPFENEPYFQRSDDLQYSQPYDNRSNSQSSDERPYSQPSDDRPNSQSSDDRPYSQLSDDSPYVQPSEHTIKEPPDDNLDDGYVEVLGTKQDCDHGYDYQNSIQRGH